MTADRFLRLLKGPHGTMGVVPRSTTPTEPDSEVGAVVGPGPDSLEPLRLRLLSCRSLVAEGCWADALTILDECSHQLAVMAPEFLVGLAFRLEIRRLLAEASYVGYKQGADNLEDMYARLRDLAEEIERLRRILPGSVGTIWLFGRVDLYERLVAVAYQLGMIAEAAEWAERAKSRALLDQLVNAVRYPGDYDD